MRFSDKGVDREEVQLAEPRSRILVVDDEEYICTIVRNMLADREGHFVKTCADPTEALTIIGTERLDLILTDMVMGPKSGVDILKACQRYQADAVVIFMTGHPTVENAISVLKLGAYDYLVKPFKLENLKLVVERGLERLQLRRENAYLKNTLSWYQISEAMGSATQREAIFDLVLESAAAELDVTLASIATLDKAENVLELQAYYGAWNEVARIPALIGSDEMNSEVVKSGKAVETQDIRIELGNHEGAVDNLKSVCACIPLLVKGEVVGTLNTIRRGTIRKPFTVGDMQLLSIIASKAASAIESANLTEALEDAYFATIRALANAVEARDHFTSGHTERVTNVAEEIAVALNWNPEQIKWLRIGGMLHDIGKLGVPDSILKKPGPLSVEEIEIMRKHPQLGAQILDGIPFLEPALPYVLYHHERWDGSGYSLGLKGEQIPIEGRLLAIADTVDAILSNRPYRAANTPEKVIAELQKFRGSQFDPDLVDIFTDLLYSGKIDLQTMYAEEQMNAPLFLPETLVSR
jgi:response regulator RpfG family c-di-GMP phosphodiesterase